MSRRPGRAVPMIKPLSPAVLIALALLAAAASPAGAVPPPLEQLGADCEAPVYASDQLVCATPSLLALDQRVARLAAADEAGWDEHVDWFRASRMCAFETEHAACLAAAYCARLARLDRAGADWPSECAVDAADYVPARKVSRRGFARSDRWAKETAGQVVALSGFVDHGNLYGDDGAREALGDAWSGPGPDAAHWRFDLKARADDPVGSAFAVIVPNGPVRDALLAVFRADAGAGRPTRVYLHGTLAAFDAPANAARRTGLRVTLRSAADLRIGPLTVGVE